jgi:tetratricopeptide (TPR) repeat protein
MTRLAAYALAVAVLVAATAAQTRPPAANEAAWRANNIGVAYLEQYNFPSAAASFRDALQAEPNLAIARLNLGIALFYGGDAKAARAAIESAKPALPDRAEPDYLLGLIARSEDRVEDAIAAFRLVREIDPGDPGATTNLGQLYLQQRDYAKAIELLRTATVAEPFNATAAYGLATALTRSNDPGAREAMDRFQALRATSYAVTYSQAYLEQGRYGEAIASTGGEAELVDKATPDVGYTEATTRLAAGQGVSPAAAIGAVTLADLDGDGDLDLIDGGGTALRALRNGGGRFVDATARWFGAAPLAPAVGVIAGDYDNDGRADLLVLRAGGITLYKQSAQGVFEDVTARAGLGALVSRPAGRTAAWVDADHDGDLDLMVTFGPVGGVVAGPDGQAYNALLRNNGDGTFTDITRQAGVAAPRVLAAVVPTDFDGRRDIDLLMAGFGAPLLFRNMRDGTFKDVAADAGLRVTGDVSAIAAGDVNKDGYPDFFFARADGPGTLALSDGRAGFKTSPLPDAANAHAAQILDYDADGLLDLLVVTTDGPRMLRNIGSGWTDVTSRAFPGPLAAAAPAPGDTVSVALATGDLDGDGLTDIVYRTRDGVRVWRNTRATPVRTVHVQLVARVSNRSAAGAKIDMRAGSLRQRLETFAAIPAPAPADVVFGLGRRTGADVVRVLWPSGILQAETPATRTGTIAGALKVEELDRKPSSCPFLFTWNGTRFEFITDFLGGGEMGYLEAPPGERNTPDPVEYVRVTGNQLQPRDGRYEVRVTNELEEAMFLDRVRLIAVAHPRDVEVWPNAGLRSTPEPFRLITTRDARPPVAAVDDAGHDVLDAVSRLDRRFVDSFASDRIRGYAREHTLTLGLPPAGPGGRRVLLLTGWTDYAFSGDNVAANQSGLQMKLPALQVEDGRGGWRTVIDDIGFPAGRPQAVTVDLTGKLPASATRVRIVTSMKIYWDRILVDVSDGAAPVAMTRLEPITASLSWRGFSKEGSPDGREPFGYDYDVVSPDSPWKQMPGRYTREGDVRELLLATDDRFVIARAGDQIALSFDAASLPTVPDGWTRTFLLYADGFSKEMDLHSASPDELAPIPFHGMARYPYAPSERPPLTAAQSSDLDRYHTRIVSRALPPLELARAAVTRAVNSTTPQLPTPK